MSDRYIELAQIRPNGILCYPEFTQNGNRLASFHARTGEIDEQKKRRFRKYSQLLLYLSSVKVHTLADGREMKWRLNSITVTLPYRVLEGDNLQKSVALFFQKLRKSGMKYYLWRKERQPGTGNLHWHIVSNRWIDKNDLRFWWCDSLARHCPGMMRAVVKKFRTRYPKAPTQVRAVYAIRGAIRDLEKYLQQADKTEGNSFGVSNRLAKIPFLTIEANNAGLERALAVGKRLDADWNSFYCLPNWLLLRSLNSDLRTEFNTWKETYALD